ncbi:NAD-dependent epimerase/dehydratase family protein [Pseudonocardia eucalypti]|uniref:NAD-dependent epimerase/dehydratase family protein n=2 Tax=Pseudonocardia eucalypti TaxID=648755 RepID=A0ABP9PMF7_9PSEU
MGASGFLGSHITRQLVERGDHVRIWVRPTSASHAFADLPVPEFRGDLFDDQALRAAMRDVATVFYCIVDARPSLHDPAPLFRTNVESLRNVLDAAVAARVERFVFCGTIGTIGHPGTGSATEDTAHTWAEMGGPYIRSRLDAENLVLSYHGERGLDAVVLCPSTTFGARDHGPVAHGRLIRAAAAGRMPFFVRNQRMEVVGVEDAARAFLLAEERGRAGERYIISERMMTSKEILTAAAEATGHKPPRIGVPLGAMRVAGRLGDVAGRAFRRDMPLTTVSVRLMHCMPPLDHGKATRELGWTPRPTPDAIREHALFFRNS